MDIPSGKWQGLYGGPGVIFAVSFNLPDRRIKLDGRDVIAKEQARIQRREHLTKNVGDLPEEPRATMKGPIDSNVKWGHCAETLTLTR